MPPSFPLPRSVFALPVVGNDGLMTAMPKNCDLAKIAGDKCVLFSVCSYWGKFNQTSLFQKRKDSGKRDHRRQGSQDKIRVPRSSAATTETTNCTEVALRRKRRKWINEKPNISLNLWSVMKNCIGKELSKIPMPVSFDVNTSFVCWWLFSFLLKHFFPKSRL